MIVLIYQYNSISADSQQALLGITYETLLTTAKGHDLCRELVTAVINKQMGHHMSVRKNNSDVSCMRCPKSVANIFFSAGGCRERYPAAHLRLILQSRGCVVLQSNRALAAGQVIFGPSGCGGSCTRVTPTL